MKLTRSFSRVQATPETESRILQVMKDLESLLGEDFTEGGAPEILWNSRTREIWVSTGDWHDTEVVRSVSDALEQVPGVKEVNGESESYPGGYNYGKGESDWKKVY